MPKKKKTSSKKIVSTKSASIAKVKKQKVVPRKISYKIEISSSWGLVKKSYQLVKFQRKFLGLALLAYTLLSAVLVINVKALN